MKQKMLDNCKVNYSQFQSEKYIIEETQKQNRTIKTQHWGKHQTESMDVTHPEDWVASK